MPGVGTAVGIAVGIAVGRATPRTGSDHWSLRPARPTRARVETPDEGLSTAHAAQRERAPVGG